MSQPAQNRAASAQRSSLSDDTGRFSIDSDRRTETVLPPASERTSITSLEELGAVMELEPDPVREAAPSPPPPPGGPRSGVFTGRPPVPPRSRPAPPAPPSGVVEDPEIVALAQALEPFYREQERQSERAQLEFADLSLQPGNPYAASSLVPPPARPFPIAKALGIAALVLVLVGAGWALGSRTAEQPVAREQPVASPAASEVAVTRPRATTPPSAAPTPAPAVAPNTAVVEEAQPALDRGAATDERAAVEPGVSQIPNRDDAVSRAAEPTPPRRPKAAASEAEEARDTVSPAETGGGSAESVPAAAAGPSSPRDLAVGEPAPTPGTAKPEAGDVPAALPETPSRAEVAAGFNAVRAQLAQCAAGKHGVAHIQATIANTGRISHALIEGDFNGTPEGSCMARAVRGATFPKFSQPMLKVSYPIAL